MKFVLDNLNDISGWTASGGDTEIYGYNYYKEYISNNLDKSLIFKFDGINSYVEKTFNQDTTGYNELVLSAYSRNKGSDF